MELSDVKLTVTATLEGLESIVLPNLSGTVKLKDLSARSLKRKKLNGYLNTYSFMGDEEGYLAQRVEGGYRIMGHWNYGTEKLKEKQRIFGHNGYSVIVERQMSEISQSTPAIAGGSEEYVAA